MSKLLSRPTCQDDYDWFPLEDWMNEGFMFSGTRNV